MASKWVYKMQHWLALLSDGCAGWARLWILADLTLADLIGMCGGTFLFLSSGKLNAVFDL